MLSDFCGRARDGVFLQSRLALDNILKVHGRITKNVEGFVIGAEAVSSNLDGALWRGLPLRTFASCWDGAPGGKRSDHPGVVRIAIRANKELAKTLQCSPGGWILLRFRVQYPRQGIVSKRPGRNIAGDFVLMIGQDGGIEANSVDKLQGAMRIRTFNEAR